MSRSAGTGCSSRWDASAACCCRRSRPKREWDAATFLSQTCRKAGLAPDSWQHGADVWRFEADVFGDEPAH